MSRWTAIGVAIALVLASAGCVHHPPAAKAPAAQVERTGGDTGWWTLIAPQNAMAQHLQEWLAQREALCSGGPPVGADTSAWAHWCATQYGWFDPKPYVSGRLPATPLAPVGAADDDGEPVPSGSSIAARDLDVGGGDRDRKASATARPSSSERSRSSSGDRQRSSQDRSRSSDRDRSSSEDRRR